MAEYRIDDLARVSGVSSRNIRAYRERGLLDPPRRVGRTAIYNDGHLGQLRSINALLVKGYNSAHIADFFRGIRHNRSLAEVLGLEPVTVPQRDAPLDMVDIPRSAPAAATIPLDIEPASAEAQWMVDAGVARIEADAVLLTDPVVVAIVARAPDPALYLAAVVRVFGATRVGVEAIAAQVVEALHECVSSRFGIDFTAGPDDIAELRALVADHRAFGGHLVSRQLDTALRRQLVRALSEYTAALLLDDFRSQGA